MANAKVVRLNSKLAGTRVPLRLLACIFVIVLLVIQVGFDITSPIVLIAAYSMCLILFLAGHILAGEPEHSLELNESGLRFNHKRGSFFVEWSNIQRVDIPSVFHFPESKNLNYIGIKLKEPLAHYESIPLRLASRILMEQRELQVMLAKEACSSGSCDLSKLTDQIEWQDKSGMRLAGLIAMYASRGEVSNQFLGFHIFISGESFVNDLDDVLKEIIVMKNRANIHINTRQP